MKEWGINQLSMSTSPFYAENTPDV